MQAGYNESALKHETMCVCVYVCVCAPRAFACVCSRACFYVIYWEYVIFWLTFQVVVQYHGWLWVLDLLFFSHLYVKYVHLIFLISTLSMYT